MTGLKETISKLKLFRRRFDQLLKSAGPNPDLTLGATRTSRLKEITDFGSNPGNLRMHVHAPKNLRPGSPLVVALHGCTQTVAAYDYGSGWSTLADRHGFAVLMPQQQTSNNPNSCFNWFSTVDTGRDHGEAHSIRQMIERTVRDHGIDRARVHIVGLSAGGAMTAAMLAAYPDLFAGGAVIAGLPYGSATTVQAALEAMAQAHERAPEAWGGLVRSASSHRGPWPKLSVWHGSADRIVNPKNAEHIIQQWTNVHGLATEPDLVQRLGEHSRRLWRDEDGADVVEAYTICGMGHGVPLVPAQDGGQAGAFHFDVGVSSSLQILKFWGLAAAHAAVLEDTTDAEAVSPALDLPLVGAMTATAARRHSRELGSASLGHGANSEGPTTDNTPFDPRDVITASLQKAGLLVPPGSRPASDPRSIITTTLRSVGLLKE